jgi:hypothetical protein
VSTIISFLVKQQVWKHGEVKATRGNMLEYLGMTFTYSEAGVTVDMKKYTRNMIEDFLIDLGNSTVPTPATDGLFTIAGNSIDLSKK